MFLGLMNSADDIIRDRAVLQRERNLNVRLPYYVSLEGALVRRFRARPVRPLRARSATAILSMRGMFWSYLGFMFMTAMGGVALGLVVSSLVDQIRRRRRTSSRWS